MRTVCQVLLCEVCICSYMLCPAQRALTQGTPLTCVGCGQGMGGAQQAAHTQYQAQKQAAVRLEGHEHLRRVCPALLMSLVQSPAVQHKDVAAHPKEGHLPLSQQRVPPNSLLRSLFEKLRSELAQALCVLCVTQKVAARRHAVACSFRVQAPQTTPGQSACNASTPSPVYRSVW
jgi:hypothetical protein